MSSPLRRHALVGLLILAAAAAGLGVQTNGRPDPALPSGPVPAGAAWQVETAFATGYAGGAYRQWLLRDAHGIKALLYIGGTGRVQTMLHWTGELGYQGEGYLVTDRRHTVVRLADGSSATFSEVRIQRMADRRLLAYAVVGPDGVLPDATSSPVLTAWAAVLGRAGPYYLVRVSVPIAVSVAEAGTAARALVAQAVPALLARVRASTSS